MSERLTNSLWVKYVENGNYTPVDQDIATCSQCGQTAECVVLRNPDLKELALCIQCSGGDE